MSLKRVVDTRFWNQVDVMERYSSQDKLFALYLMTCPRSTQLGIYSLPKRVIAFDMSLDDAQVGQLLARFQDDYQVIAYSDQTQEVAILDFLTYSLVKGGQPVERLLRNQAEDVRDSQLLVKVFQHLASYYEHSHRLIDQLSQEVLATELKRRQELGSEGEGVSPLSQGTQLLSGSQETHGASSRLGSSDLHNQDPNQKDNQIHKENQSHNHKQNQNHNSASKLDPDSEGKLDARELGESSAKEVINDWAASSELGTTSSRPTSSQPHTTSSSTTSSQPFGQAINLPDQSLSQTLARAQSLTSQTGQSQSGLSQQTMDQFVRVERDMAKLRPFYERYFGPMSEAESLQFRNWLDKIGYWPVIEAIEQAHRRQAKKPFAYISTICQQASKS
ncbi:DnaD domain protein [Abiotrophia defectiva]|uniref:DnaD domain protein n=1 Tax=Abiotrophia defectiva TaxID=46125 RepID=UPI0028D2E064|nr:DnaD domain protein [Abiotrophia defectiva]